MTTALLQYTVATQVLLSVAFKTESGDAFDPPVVTASVRDPDGEVEQFTIADMTNPAVGTYELRYSPLKNGLYQFRFAGYELDEEPLAAGESVFTAQTAFLGEGAP